MFQFNLAYNEMFLLMNDWEAKKTDYLPGKKVWISVSDILDELGISSKDLEGLRKQFNSKSRVRPQYIIW